MYRRVTIGYELQEDHETLRNDQAFWMMSMLYLIIFIK